MRKFKVFRVGIRSLITWTCQYCGRMQVNRELEFVGEISIRCEACNLDNEIDFNAVSNAIDDSMLKWFQERLDRR